MRALHAKSFLPRVLSHATGSEGSLLYVDLDRPPVSTTRGKGSTTTGNDKGRFEVRTRQRNIRGGSK